MKKIIVVISFLFIASGMLWANNSQLFKAIEKNNFDLVVDLVEGGANIWEKNEKGLTAIHYAAALGNIKILKLLMQKKPYITTDRFVLSWPVIVLVCLVFLILSILMGALYSHKLAGPIYRIEKSILALVNGARNIKIKLRKKDEFKKLADTVNRLIDYVKGNSSVLLEIKFLISEFEQKQDKKFLDEVTNLIETHLEDLEV